MGLGAFRKVWVRSQRRARAFAEEFGVCSAASAEEAELEADVIVAATTSQTLVLAGGSLASGAHVNAAGVAWLD